MKYENPATGERRILGLRGRRRRARELEAAGWVRIGGTGADELLELQRREAEYHRGRHEEQQELLAAMAGQAGDETDEDLSSSGAGQDESSAGDGDAGHLPDPGL